MWQSWVEIEHYSIVYLLYLKRYCAELLLRAKLICTTLMRGYLIILHSEYEPHS